MEVNVKDHFLQCLSNYTNDVSALELWNEIEVAYTERHRHYHNLNHLNHLVHSLISFRSRFAKWDIVVFSIAYHDVVYNVLKKNNEKKSAEFAANRLKKIGVMQDDIAVVMAFISATKHHENASEEINLFTDADLGILGADEVAYSKYVDQIRKEYSIFPDLLYNPGRRKVLEHFLKMNRIFKSEDFFQRYKDKARKNLSTELSQL
jgi:predicted metal-dependent HD superfamily phosphohydrolase